MDLDGPGESTSSQDHKTSEYQSILPTTNALVTAQIHKSDR